MSAALSLSLSLSLSLASLLFSFAFILFATAVAPPPFLPSFLQATLAQIAQLAELEELTLGGWVSQLSLEPLVGMTQLRKLDIRNIGQVSAANVEVLRSLQQLHELDSRVSWAQLLVPGHHLQLRSFKRALATQVECDALASVPSLTRVYLQRAECSHIDALAELPRLQQLMLSFHPSINRLTWADPPRIVAALRQCSQLRELSVHSWAEHDVVFVDEGLRECVQSMPLLRSLDVSGCTHIPSLTFFASGSITSTLTCLRLARFSPRLPVAELKCLLQLRSLERVELVRLFERDLTSEEAAPFAPPSQLMPALRSCFSYHG